MKASNYVSDVIMWRLFDYYRKIKILTCGGSVTCDISLMCSRFMKLDHFMMIKINKNLRNERENQDYGKSV